MTQQEKCKHPDGCPKKPWADGWCSMHYNRVHRTGDPGPVGTLRKPPAGPCKHPDGCPRTAARASGYCNMHHERAKNNDGDPGPVGTVLNRPKKQSETCLVPNEDGPGLCGASPTVAHDMCGTHVKRIQRNGTLERTRARFTRFSTQR